MAKLSFSLDGFKTAAFQSLDLPLDIRKPNLGLVKKILSSQSVELPPGKYFLTASLPAGQQLRKEVEIAGTDMVAHLAPEAEDESPFESHEHHHFLAQSLKLLPAKWSFLGSVLRGRAEDADSVPQTSSVSVWLLLGSDPLEADRVPFGNPSDARQLGRTVQFQYREATPRYAPLQHFLEVVQPDQSATRVALPVSPDHSCTVMLKAGSGDIEGSVDVHLENTQADFLLRALQRGQVAEAIAAGESEKMSATTLLEQKTGDPIAAAVGAYLLLQCGDPQRLQDWTENLKNWFPWLPDGLAIRGEHLAQLGKHDEALANFAELKLRGTPLFRDGLSFAIERLSSYTRPTGHATSRFSPELLNNAKKVLDWLQNVAEATDFSQPILTTSGPKPAAADVALAQTSATLTPVIFNFTS